MILREDSIARLTPSKLLTLIPAISIELVGWTGYECHLYLL